LPVNIWARQQTVNRLRSLLSEFFPNALKAFPVLTHRAALTVLAAVPTPAAAAKLTHRRVVALLRRSGRGDRPGLAERILGDLTAPALRQRPLVEAAFAKSVRGLVAVIEAMQSGIAELETALNTEFERHHHANLLRAAPGLGPILAARVLGEIGDDPGRFATADALRSFAGTAPITRASGRSKIVSARRIRNRRLADAATGGPSRRSPNHPEHEPTTTAGERPATATTPPYATSPTSSSDDSGGASPTTSPGTTTPPGQPLPTAPNRLPLDI
jgi:transposase